MIHRHFPDVNQLPRSHSSSPTSSGHTHLLLGEGGHDLGPEHLAGSTPVLTAGHLLRGASADRYSQRIHGTSGPQAAGTQSQLLDSSLGHVHPGTPILEVVLST